MSTSACQKNHLITDLDRIAPHARLPRPPAAALLRLAPHLQRTQRRGSNTQWGVLCYDWTRFCGRGGGGGGSYKQGGLMLRVLGTYNSVDYATINIIKSRVPSCPAATMLPPRLMFYGMPRCARRRRCALASPEVVRLLPLPRPPATHPGLFGRCAPPPRPVCGLASAPSRRCRRRGWLQMMSNRITLVKSCPSL